MTTKNFYYVDRKLIGFICCMWALAYCVLFGAEARLFFHIGEYVTPFVLAIGFFVMCFAVQRVLIDHAIHRPTLVIAGKRKTVTLLPAHEGVRNYVLERAHELGFQDDLQVFYLPSTWTLVDAYVFGTGTYQGLVVTGGLQSMLLRRRPTEAEQFRFVIDHELGHVAGRDTNLLYFARSILLCAILLMPVKLVLLFGLGYQLVLASYRDMLPKTTLSSIFVNTYGLTEDVGDIALIVIFSVYSLVLLILVFWFYVVIVRRREFFADRFALRHSFDAAHATTIIAKVLGRPGLSSAPAHSFAGNIRWHPTTMERLITIRSRFVAGIPDHIAVVMVVLTLLTFRLTLGRLWVSAEHAQLATHLAPISAAFALLIGTVVDCMVNDGSLRSRRDKLPGAFAELMRLALWTLLASGVLALIAHNRPDDALFSMQPERFLIEVELTERLWLILSFPVIIVVFGLVMIAAAYVPVRYVAGRSTEILRVSLASAVAVSILWTLGLLADPIIRAHRAAKIEEYSTAVMEAQNERKSTSKSELGLPNFDLDDNSPFGFGQRKRDAMLDAQMLLLVQMKSKVVYSPPFGFVALWQGPFFGMGIE